MQDFRGDYCQRPLRHYGAFRERFMQHLSAWRVKITRFGVVDSEPYLGVEFVQHGDLPKTHTLPSL